VICPTGKSPDWLSSPCRKNFSLCRLVETGIERIIPSQTEGRFAIVTDVGCGMRWTRAAPKTKALSRTAESCGSDAPMLASSLREEAQTTVTNKPIAGESAK
jgi:hypothetical protein